MSVHIEVTLDTHKQQQQQHISSYYTNNQFNKMIDDISIIQNNSYVVASI